MLSDGGPDDGALAPAVAAAIAAWEGVGVPQVAVAFARDVVASARPAGPPRARSLLWACSRLAAWGTGVGLEVVPGVLLHPSVTERFVRVGMEGASESARRTARTNLRFVARRAAPGLAHPPTPLALARTRAKAPYGPAEVEAFFALAATQPTEARRRRLEGLLCLGLGAGLERAELRGVTGRHVRSHGGGSSSSSTGPGPAGCRCWPATATAWPMPPPSPGRASSAGGPRPRAAT